MLFPLDYPEKSFGAEKLIFLLSPPLFFLSYSNEETRTRVDIELIRKYLLPSKTVECYVIRRNTKEGKASHEGHEGSTKVTFRVLCAIRLVCTL